MTSLSEEQREKLGEELGAIGLAMIGIDAAMAPFTHALRALGDQRSRILERYGVQEPLGACESCGRILIEGDDGHRTADDVLLCADDAPTYGDLKKQLTEPVGDPDHPELGTPPDLDAEDEAGIAPRERLAAIDAHIAGGGSLDDKIIHPL